MTRDVTTGATGAAGASGPEQLARRLLGRRDEPLGTQVLVVVDPERPGAAQLRVPGGGPLSERVADLAVREAGERAGPVLREASTTATVDQVAAVLRRRADVPFAGVDAATVATGTALGDVVADPRPEGASLRSQDGTVVAVRVPSGHRAAVADQLQQLLTRAPGARVLDLLVDACTAAGVPLADRSDDLLPVQWAADSGTLQTGLASLDLDEVRLRLRRAQRSDDGFLSTFLVRPLSRRVTPVAVRRGVAPSTVTTVALGLGLLAAVAYGLAAAGSATAWRGIGSVLLLASLVVDCVDGEVARSTRTVSPRGGWLDVAADRVKEYAVYAGLAIGTGGGRTAWWLAFAAMALLVTRHFVDFGFAARGAAASRGPGGQGAQASVAPGARVAAWSDRTSERPALKWAKRAVIMPVGERTLLLVVLAPLAGVPTTLTVLLALGVVAAGWTTVGRVGRSLGGVGSGHGGPKSTTDDGPARPCPSVARLRAQLDVAPVPVPSGLLGTRWGWLLPAVARAMEQALVAVLVGWLSPQSLPWAFAWLAVVAFGLYDVVYRQRLTGDADVRGLVVGVPFGWPVRLLLVLVALVTAGGHAGVVLAVAAGLLAVVLLVSSGRYWSAPVPSTP